jgi:hypothetical protein
MHRRVMNAAFCGMLMVATWLGQGCSAPATTGEVVGTVTLDGKPVDSGTVHFKPVDGQTSTAGATIEKGKFSVVVPIAKHRVEISAIQLASGGDAAAARHSDAGYATVELIPAKYNRNSELTMDVKSGRNERNFDLKSR